MSRGLSDLLRRQVVFGVEPAGTHATPQVVDIVVDLGVRDIDPLLPGITV